RFFDDPDAARSFRHGFTAAATATVYQRARDTTPGEPPAVPAQPAAPSPAAPSSTALPAVSPRRVDPADPDQPGALTETQRERRGHDFYPPADLAASVPRLYATERQPAEDKTLHLHYFGGAIDVWLAEYDPDTGTGYGYVCLGNPDDAEWGYVSLPELEPINRGLLIIERDLYWTPVRAAEANLPGHRAPRPAATTDPAPQPTSPPDRAPDPQPQPAPSPQQTSSPAAPARDARHPDDLVACTCCRPAGAQRGPVSTDAGDPPKFGQFAYGASGDLGILAGKRWLKVVTLRNGAPSSAEAFIDPTTGEWYGPASWKSPNKNHPLTGPDRAWLTARLPYLAPPADLTPTSSADASATALTAPSAAAPGTVPARDTTATTGVAVTDPDRAPDPPARPWLAGLVIGEEVATADGHRVSRRTNRTGTTVYVDARHPQLGMLSRGWLAVAPGHLTDGEAWNLVDQDGRPVGEHHGSYLDAETRLLAATSALDRPLDEAELAEMDRDEPEPHPEPDAGPAGTSEHRPDEREPDQARPAPTVATGVTRAAASTSPSLATSAPAPALAAPPATPENLGVPDAAAAAPAPSWTSRIQVVDGASLVVRGTSGDPREEGLRGLLKQHRFRWNRTSSEWRYTGRPADRPAVIGDIRRWLAAREPTEADAVGQPDRRPAALAPSVQQQAIIDAYQAGKTIAVQALAGTGKTSTLLMLAGTRPEARIAYIAFNRSIADEAKRKFGRNVRADTSHSFAREGLAGHPLQPKLARIGQGARWPEDWVRHLGIVGIDGEVPIEPESIARLVMATVRNFRESAADTVGAPHLPPHLPEGVPGLPRAVLEYARAAWADIADPAGQLLFDHDDYLKVWALGNPRLPYDVIFFDEAQDINPVLRKVIQQQPQQTIVVGDSNQSIYGFRGAVDALKNWPADMVLPLTQSWRFGPEVAEVGNQFLGLLKSRWLLSGNPALDSSIGLVDAPDAVLARTNAGAVAAVFDAFDEGRRVALMGGGRAIEEIAKAAKDLQAGRGTKHPDLARFRNWDEVRAYVEDGEDAQSLRAFVRLVDRRGADGLLQMVKDLVHEDETGPDGRPTYDVIVSTVHKAKGREWPQVRIADDFPQPQENQQTHKVVLPDAEQLRLAYVAVTRAKQRLELGSLGWIDDVAPRAAKQPAPAAAPDLAVTDPEQPTTVPARDAADDRQPARAGEDPPTTTTAPAADPLAGFT
ncbi:MAG TPA: UvrD-helicase domain-containing protein, partial [Rugosimonospora sp.]|nr:UvrD-helicase domain-containing protein [Rugosimonospora sp.]